MSAWTLEEQLAFDIAFALKKVAIPAFVRRSRRRIASQSRKRSPHTSSCASGSSQSLRNGCNDGRRGQRNELE
jgi:hypothetical protein